MVPPTTATYPLSLHDALPILAPGGESIDAHAARHEPSSHPLPTVTRDEAARRSQQARGEHQYRPGDREPRRGILIGHGGGGEEHHTGRGQQEVAIAPKDVASSNTSRHYIPTPCSFSLRWRAAVVPSCQTPSWPTPTHFWSFSTTFEPFEPRPV